MLGKLLNQVKFLVANGYDHTPLLKQIHKEIPSKHNLDGNVHHLEEIFMHLNQINLLKAEKFKDNPKKYSDNLVELKINNK